MDSDGDRRSDQRADIAYGLCKCTEHELHCSETIVSEPDEAGMCDNCNSPWYSNEKNRH